MALPKNAAASLGQPYGTLTENTSTSDPKNQPSNMKTNELFDVVFDPNDLADGDRLVWDATTNKFILATVLPVPSTIILSGGATTVASAPATVVVESGIGIITLPSGEDSGGYPIVVGTLSGGATGIVRAPSGDTYNGASGVTSGAPLTLVANGTRWYAI